jgi:hypothetical protein
MWKHPEFTRATSNPAPGCPCPVPHWFSEGIREGRVRAPWLRSPSPIHPAQTQIYIVLPGVINQNPRLSIHRAALALAKRAGPRDAYARAREKGRHGPGRESWLLTFSLWRSLWGSKFNEEEVTFYSKLQTREREEEEKPGRQTGRLNTEEPRARHLKTL